MAVCRGSVQTRLLNETRVVYTCLLLCTCICTTCYQQLSLLFLTDAWNHFRVTNVPWHYGHERLPDLVQTSKPRTMIFTYLLRPTYLLTYLLIFRPRPIIDIVNDLTPASSVENGVAVKMRTGKRRTKKNKRRKDIGQRNTGPKSRLKLSRSPLRGSPIIT